MPSPLRRRLWNAPRAAMSRAGAPPRSTGGLASWRINPRVTLAWHIRATRSGQWPACVDARTEVQSACSIPDYAHRTRSAAAITARDAPLCPAVARRRPDRRDGTTASIEPGDAWQGRDRPAPDVSGHRPAPDQLRFHRAPTTAGELEKFMTLERSAERSTSYCRCTSGRMRDFNTSQDALRPARQPEADRDWREFRNKPLDDRRYARKLTSWLTSLAS